jgi:hypothetical protein
MPGYIRVSGQGTYPEAGTVRPRRDIRQTQPADIDYRLRLFHPHLPKIKKIGAAGQEPSFGSTPDQS